MSNELNGGDFSEVDLNNAMPRHDKNIRNSAISNGIDRQPSKIEALKAQISRDEEEAAEKWKPFKDIR